MTVVQNIPSQLKWLEKKGEFIIDWKDTHKSAFSFPYLRHHCPCALCREATVDTNPLKMLQVTEPPQPKFIEPVGNYAVRIDWNDGHSSGIYTFDFLRSLCSCSLCTHA